MFEGVIDDFSDYYRAYTSAGVEGFEQTAGMEVLRRLRHLDYLLHEVEWGTGLLSFELDIGNGQVEPAGSDALVRRFQSASRWTTRRLADLGLLEIELTEQIEMIVESFYFHAHRLLKLLQKGPLAGFDGLEANGVLVVRNQLIEHFPWSDMASVAQLGLQRRSGRTEADQVERPC